MGVARQGGDVNGGCETVMDLAFGGCKLQVQVPEKGQYATTADLVGQTIGTSFPGLTLQHFAKIEAGIDPSSEQKVPTDNIRTKVIELSGSVEAACALGVANGIVDLVGKSNKATCTRRYRVRGN